MKGKEDYMSTWFCVDRIRNNSNKVIRYIVKDINTGIVQEILVENIKEFIARENVLNLRITKDGRVYLMNSNFQDEVDKQNSKYSNMKDFNKIEDSVDYLMTKVTSLLLNEYMSFYGLTTKGDTNSFCINIEGSKLGGKDTSLIIRYRKNIVEPNKNSKKVQVIAQIVGLTSKEGNVEFNQDKAFHSFAFDCNPNKITNKTVTDFANSLFRYVAEQCKLNCNLKRITDSRIDTCNKQISNRIKKSLATAMLIIISSSQLLVGCSSTPTVENVSTTSITQEQENAQVKVYKCDYKSTSVFKTQIVTEIDGEQVSIEGNIVKLIEDPLVMRNKDGNILGEVSDNYNFINEDDHAIVVNGQVEAIMKGNFNLIGKSYKLYDSDNEYLGKFERSVMGWGGTITDKDGKVLAEYEKDIMDSDFNIKVHQNDKLSDRAIILLLSAFVSDQVYENKS